MFAVQEDPGVQLKVLPQEEVENVDVVLGVPEPINTVTQTEDHENSIGDTGASSMATDDGAKHLFQERAL